LSEKFANALERSAVGVRPSSGAATLAERSGAASSQAHDRSLAAAPGDGRTPLMSALLKLVDDPELTVRYQLALSLGEWKEPRAGEALGKLALRDLGDEWMRAAILSSATRQPADILKVVLAADSSKQGRSELVSQ